MLILLFFLKQLKSYIHDPTQKAASMFVFTEKNLNFPFFPYKMVLTSIKCLLNASMYNVCIL